MKIYEEEKVIPNYPFEMDVESGNPMFRIRKNDSVVNYRNTDFLVPHRKDFYFFAFVKQGSSRHWIDMKPYTLKPDTFYFTTPHQIHLKEETKPLSGISISFSRDFLELEDAALKDLPIIQNPHNGHELVLDKSDLAFVEDLLKKILGEYRTPGDWQNNMIRAYMKVLLIYLSRLYKDQFTDDELFPQRMLLNKFIARVEESFDHSHEVGDYAEMLNISAGHLGELVKEQSGKMAMAHIHERILLEAKRLLFHTDQSVKEIAFSLGFEDASYFNRFFKRMTEQTPLQYRHHIREIYH